MIHQAPDFLRNPNHNINICVIGAGGTGSLILSRLARLNYALKQSNRAGLNVTVYDGDTVEAHNVGRQMFTPQDIGEHKSFALVSKINRAFLTDFKAVVHHFEITKGIQHQNIFITAVDNAQFRIEFDTYFKQLESNNESLRNHHQSYYWMDFGNSKNNGQCVLGSNHIEQNNSSEEFCSKLPTVIDLFPNIEAQDTKEIQGTSCSYQSKLNEQSLFINDSLSSIGMHLLYDLLIIGHIELHGFFLNLETYKLNPLKI